MYLRDLIWAREERGLDICSTEACDERPEVLRSAGERRCGFLLAWNKRKGIIEAKWEEARKKGRKRFRDCSKEHC